MRLLDYELGQRNAPGPYIEEPLIWVIPKLFYTPVILEWFFCKKWVDQKELSLRFDLRKTGYPTYFSGHE